MSFRVLARASIAEGPGAELRQGDGPGMTRATPSHLLGQRRLNPGWVRQTRRASGVVSRRTDGYMGQARFRATAKKKRPYVSFSARPPDSPEARVHPRRSGTGDALCLRAHGL